MEQLKNTELRKAQTEVENVLQEKKMLLQALEEEKERTGIQVRTELLMYNVGHLQNMSIL